MIFIYGETQSLRKTAKQFSLTYPNANKPDQRTVSRLVERFCATGGVTDKPFEMAKTKAEGENKENIVAPFGCNPNQSVRH